MATLGIDIGTFESKGALVDEDGRVLAQAARAHEMIVPRPGWAEHDPERDWWGDTVHLCRTLLQATEIRPEAIRAIAISAIGPCMLPVDREGRPLMQGVLYGVDTRASAEIAALNRQMGADAILSRGGNPLTSQAVGPKILWLRRNHPDIWARTARIHSATGFIVERLTGAAVIDHYTAAGFTPLYDIARRDWADLPDLCPRERLPHLMWSSGIAGHLTPAAAGATGLAAGTPVTCGTIDAAAEAISVGVSAPGQTMMMYGSTIFAIQITDRPLADARMWSAPWLFPGRHALMAGLATSGTLTHWFRDRFARDLPRETAFATLTAEAAVSPKGASGLICLPYFSGERTPIHDPLARGAFFGLNLTHGRGDLYRAVLEGIAMATAHLVEAYVEAGARPDLIRAVGGGTRNPVWLAATSDLTGVPQELCEQGFGASYGDAFLAALASGAAGPEDIGRWNPVRERLDPRHVPAYERQYPLFRKLYLQTRDIAHALSDEPEAP
ncbi:MAG: FGGY-family carbohydrate kinase [Paracoccus sp. (in: a-proteobacteria)]